MTNIAPRLEAQLDTISLRQLRGIAAVAEIHGAQTYLVGGAVRDALLGLQVTDIDIAVVGMTSGLPRGVARALNGRVVAHSQFNTFALEASGRHIDLAMARHETYAKPGALPTVAPGTMQQDLARRDFTVNAMAVSISANSFGDLLDPFNGKSDLNSGRLRVLHDESFKDDATRILRAARYAVRLGITLEAHTEHLLRRDGAFLETISPPRLRDEFEHVLQEGRAVQSLELLHSLGALQSVHPALAMNSQTLDALRRAEHTDCSDKPTLLLSILAFEMNATGRANFTDRLRLTARWAKAVQDTGVVRSRILDDPSFSALSRSELYAQLKGIDEAALLGYVLSQDENAAAGGVKLYLDELRHIKPVLNGNDLLVLGVPQGSLIGHVLEASSFRRLSLIQNCSDVEFYGADPAQRSLGDHPIGAQQVCQDAEHHQLHGHEQRDGTDDEGLHVA